MKTIISRAITLMFVASSSNVHAQPPVDTTHFAKPIPMHAPISGLYKWANSPESDSAELAILSPVNGQLFKTGDSVFVTVSVAGIAIGAQTAHATTCGLLNSPAGQHTHIVLDDGTILTNHTTGQPYFVGVAASGTHTLRVFACRSWHESIKSLGSFKWVTYHVDDTTTGSPDSPIEDGQPILTFNCPAGNYEIEEAQSALIDFYLSNVPLSPEGFRVRLTVDSVSTSLSEWVPYFLTGLSKGDHKITLDLQDARGARLAGPYTSASRSITVK